MAMCSMRVTSRTKLKMRDMFLVIFILAQLGVSAARLNEKNVLRRKRKETDNATSLANYEYPSFSYPNVDNTILDVDDNTILDANAGRSNHTFVRRAQTCVNTWHQLRQRLRQNNGGNQEVWLCQGLIRASGNPIVVEAPNIHLRCRAGTAQACRIKATNNLRNRFFNIQANDFRISHVTIIGRGTYARATRGNGGCIAKFSGGRLTITDSRIEGCHARGNGAAIYVQAGEINLVGTDFEDNKAQTRRHNRGVGGTGLVYVESFGSRSNTARSTAGRNNANRCPNGIWIDDRCRNFNSGGGGYYDDDYYYGGGGYYRDGSGYYRDGSGTTFCYGEGRSNDLDDLATELRGGEGGIFNLCEGTSFVTSTIVVGRRDFVLQCAGASRSCTLNGRGSTGPLLELSSSCTGAEIFDVQFTLGKNTDVQTGGGALRIYGPNNRITGCDFVHNEARYGGAIWTSDSSSSSTNTELSLNRFFANKASLQGGAVYMQAVDELAFLSVNGGSSNECKRTSCDDGYNPRSGLCYTFTLTDGALSALGARSSGGGVYMVGRSSEPFDDKASEDAGNETAATAPPHTENGDGRE